MTKYIKPIIITILCFYFIRSSHAQKSVNHAILIDPLQVIGMYNSSIDISYAYLTETNFNYLYSIGIIIPKDVWGSDQGSGTGRMNGKGIILGFEPKLKLKKKYIGISASYTLHNYDSHRLLSQVSNDLIKYQVNQQVLSCYLQFGQLHFDTDQMVFDGSISIGARIIHINNNATSLISNYSEINRLSSYLEVEEKGWHALLGIKFSIRIGRTLSKKKV